MKVLGSPVLIVIFTLVLIILLYRYWIMLNAILFRYRALLFSLRLITLICLLLLLINPWFNFERKEKVSQKVDLILDHSESMMDHYEKTGLNVRTILSKINQWGYANQVRLKHYRLGENILPLENLDIYDFSTNFSQLGKFMEFENPNHLLLITDGQATVGRELNDLNLPDSIPIHVLGVGPVKKVNDLIIKSVDIPQKSIEGDTINIIVKLESHLINSQTSQLQIQNGLYETIYDSTISFDSGNKMNEINISIPVNNFSGLNKMRILPIIDEVKIENNLFEFHVNIRSSENQVLLISGALSLNTSIIKSTLNSFEKTEIKHYYRIDATRWNKTFSNFLFNNYKMVVLDNFPIGANDQSILNNIIFESELNKFSIVYIEGPNSNLNAAEMIRSHYPKFIPHIIDPNISTALLNESMNIETIGINLSDFPPQNRLVKWTTNNKHWISYTDGSFMVATYDNLFMIAAPDIATNHLKTKQNYTSSMQDLMMNILIHAYYWNDGFLTLHINKKSFNIGENAYATISIVNNLELKNILLTSIYDDSDTARVECKKELFSQDYKCRQLLDKSGEYSFIAESRLPNGEKVVSNLTHVVVQSVNLELKDLIQDQNMLKIISHNSGGKYMGIDSLDTMLANMEITPIQLIKKYQISGLSTQYYWWLIIVLLSTEWFIRKKLGLL